MEVFIRDEDGVEIIKSFGKGNERFFSNKENEKYYIKAKCKSLDNGETLEIWVKGLLNIDECGDFWIDIGAKDGCLMIDKDTICRNTNFRDKERNYVYENDIVKIYRFGNEIDNCLYYLTLDNNKFVAKGFYNGMIENPRIAEIIDNIYSETSKVLIKKDIENINNKQTVIDNSDCRSDYKRNKKRW